MNEAQLLKNLTTYTKNFQKGIHELLDYDTASALADAMKNENRIVSPKLKEIVSTLNRIPRNNFSKIEKLSKPTIGIMASLAYYSARTAKSPIDGSRYVEEDESQALNPFYRRGLELAAASPSLPSIERMLARENSIEMNEAILRNTLAPVKYKSQEVRRLQKELKTPDRVRKAVSENRLQQQTIAKALLLAHLGSMHTVQKDGRNSVYTGSIAEVFAHGGRTVFFLPKSSGEAADITQKSIFNNYYDKADHGTAVEGRAAASHSMVQGNAESGAGSFKETGNITLRHNYQMNPAIGGLGRMFGDKPILNDGLNGQMFLQIQLGTPNKGGYLMVGFENEQSLKTGRAGHFHSFIPSSAKFSSFIADKGGPGASKGGRVVDLSMYSPDFLNALLDKFNKAYSDLQAKAEAYGSSPKVRKQDADDFNSVNRALSGKMLSPSELLTVLKELGISRSMTYTENGQKKEVDLGMLFGKKEELAASRFTALNDKAAEKDRAVRQRLGIKEYPYPKMGPGFQAFQPAQDMQTALNDLLKAKRTFSRSDSDKMKKIKIQLGDLQNRLSGGTLDAATAKQMYLDLAESTASYISDTHKSQRNNRMKAVKTVDRYIRNELKLFGLDLPDPALQPAVKEVKRSEPVMKR